MYKPERGGSIVGRTEVYEKFQCRPENVIDFLAILGDSADNVSGVSGIGEKGAKSLVSQFGSLENIYANLDAIDNKRKMKDLLVSGKESAFLSRRLVTINKNIPIEFDIEEFRYKRPDIQKLNDLFQELEFSMKLDANAALTTAPQSPKNVIHGW
jgi:DNA polymerase-1